ACRGGAGIRNQRRSRGWLALAPLVSSENPMRTTIFVAAFASFIPLAYADDEPKKSGDRNTLYEELKRALPDDSQRARTARLELDYWNNNHFRFLSQPVRRSLNTKDGKAAEVVLLNAPSASMPGTEFSMALLIIDKRVVDTVSCWTYNR